MKFLTFENKVGKFYFCYTVGCRKTYLMFNTSNNQFYISDNTDVESLLSWYKCSEISKDIFFNVFDSYVKQEKNFIDLICR
jgi:hypothetical protein